MYASAAWLGSTVGTWSLTHAFFVVVPSPHAPDCPFGLHQCDAGVLWEYVSVNVSMSQERLTCLQWSGLHRCG